MRHAMNFHPEWGCLAPAPSFLRTIRTVLVATAVGATAGGGVVLSLGWALGRPNVSCRAHIGAAYSGGVNFGQRASNCPTEPPAAKPEGVHGSFVG